MAAHEYNYSWVFIFLLEMIAAVKKISRIMKEF